MKQSLKAFALLILTLSLTDCSYNPFASNNHLTGSGTGAVVGAAAGGGAAAALDGNKGWIGFSALAGTMIGYYATTLQFDASGVTNAGGTVYQVGDYVGIYIKTDCLFEPNTADFKPQSQAILASAAAVLKRFPNRDILVSGNTSGFYCSRFERALSERRAQKVAAFLWKSGINNFEEGGAGLRKLNYVGYGDWFPLSSKKINAGLRSNSRIQITVYPTGESLGVTGKRLAFNNVGAIED